MQPENEPIIDIATMKNLLGYDPDTGKISWKNDMNRGRIPAGTEVGSAYPDGYKRLNIDGKMHMAHRLAYALATEKQPEAIIDHIDGNRMNNSITNLRVANAMQNAHNTRISKRNTSGLKGVYWDKYHQKYRARVMVNGRQNHLGLFTDLKDAQGAIEKARKRLHGDFANTGVVPEQVGEAEMEIPVTSQTIKVASFYSWAI